MADISDFSNDISLHDEVTHNAVTTTESGEPENKVSLDVNITNPNLNFSAGANIRYDEMTIDQVVGTTYVTVYSNSTPGKLYSVYMYFNAVDIQIKIIIDGTTIVNGIDIGNVATNYKLNVGSYAQVPRFLYTLDNGKGIVIELPEAAPYVTSVVIQAKHSTTNRQLDRGLVVRSEF